MHLCLFAWAFWRCIISTVLPGILHHFFTKTQTRPFIFILFIWQVQDYLLTQRILVVTLGCVGCWSLVLYAAEVPLHFLTNQKNHVNHNCSELGCSSWQVGQFLLWKRGPISDVAPHVRTLFRNAREVTVEPQCITTFGKGRRARGLIIWRVRCITQNS